jgi:uncharacterized SAM-binding protein YcdF (DUF218 family)
MSNPIQGKGPQTVEGSPPKKVRKERRPLRRWLRWGFPLGLLLALLLTHSLWLRASARFLIVDEPIERADVVVSLSGGSLRVGRAIELYRQGRVRKIFLPFDLEERLGFLGMSVPEMVKAKAVSLGIRPEDILLQDGVTSTEEDARVSRQVLERHGFRSAIILTSAFHTRRAALAFRRVFRDSPVRIFIAAVPLEEEGYRLDRWWTEERELVFVINEYIKLVLYLFKYGI